MRVFFGFMLPLFGTAIGAMAVYGMRGAGNLRVQRLLGGFAGGVMTAAAVWSLLLPAIAQAKNLGQLAFVPALVGVWLGALLLLGLDRLSARWRLEQAAKLQHGTWMMLLAIVIHNLPEGMAVGAAFAGVRSGSPGLTLTGAYALSLGIAIQNVPEGAIISMPLHAEGVRKGKACLWGVLSGAVEPLAGLLMLAFSQIMSPLMPYLLSFAAGAMLYVVVQELAPAMAEENSAAGALLFTLGFTLMMALDVALG